MGLNTETIRVFFSIHVPEEISIKFFNTVPENLSVQWYPKENFHITLQFIGNVAPEECERLFVVGDVAAAHARVLPIVPEKFYVEDRRLRLGIAPSAELNKLRENILVCLRKIEIGSDKIDNRPYGPHITLGRPTAKLDLSALGVPTNYGFIAKEFGLYKSEPGENNLGQYTLLKKFELR